MVIERWTSLIMAYISVTDCMCSLYNIYHLTIILYTLKIKKVIRSDLKSNSLMKMSFSKHNSSWLNIDVMCPEY